MPLQLATVSHELRTPLNAIVGWVEILRRRRDQATVESVLAALERSTTIQARLLEDLLDVGRFALGRVRLNPQSIGVNDLVNAVVEMLRPVAESQAIRLDTELDAAAPTVTADGLRLQQVLWNLLVNAIKFTPGDGAVMIRTARREDTIEVSVRDSGPGIPDDMLPVLFDPFRQGTNATASGLGLGLAIARHIVNAHGGTITARNLAGRGSVFTVALSRTWRAPASLLVV